MRRAARTDENHAEIARALRAIGAHVTDLSRVGQGCPDLLVGYRGLWRVLEIKDGGKSPSRRRLTDAQRQWHAQTCAPVHVVTSTWEALEAIGAYVTATSWRQAMGDR